MRLTKKKNLQEGEFVVYAPGAHWSKAIDSLVVVGLILTYFIVEISFNVSLYMIAAATIIILAILTLYFLLEVLQTVNMGYFITNKLIIILFLMCPLLAALYWSSADSVFSQIVFLIILNIKYVLFTLVVLSAIHFIMQIIRFCNEEYCITNKRIIIKRGVFTENITDIPIGKLEGINIVQGFMGSLLNYGTIRILGLGGSRQYLLTVEKPYVVRRKIDMVIEKDRRVIVVNADYPPFDPEPAKPERSDIFDYGIIVKYLGPQKKPI